MIFRVNGHPVQPRLLNSKGFHYLATCYSKFPRGTEAAHREACRIAGFLIADGINVFSPIAHTHCIAQHSGLDPLDHDIWMALDKPMMDAAVGLIVAEMEGWRESVGVQQEIEYFQTKGKPVVHLSLEDSGNIVFNKYAVRGVL